MYNVAREDNKVSSTRVALEILSRHRSIQSREDVINLFTLVFRTFCEEATPPNLVEFFSSHNISSSYAFCQDAEVDKDHAHPSVRYDLYLNNKAVVRLSYFEYDGQRHLCPDFTPLI